MYVLPVNNASLAILSGNPEIGNLCTHITNPLLSPHIPLAVQTRWPATSIEQGDPYTPINPIQTCPMHQYTVARKTAAEDNHRTAPRSAICPAQHVCPMCTYCFTSWPAAQGT